LPPIRTARLASPSLPQVSAREKYRRTDDCKNTKCSKKDFMTPPKEIGCSSLAAHSHRRASSHEGQVQPAKEGVLDSECEGAAGGNCGGGVATVFPYQELRKTGNRISGRCGVKTSFCTCSVAYWGAGVTAGSPVELAAWLVADIQAVTSVRRRVTAIGQGAEREPSRQADAGIAAQKTTTANISNAPFLPQFMVFRPFSSSASHIGRVVTVI